MWCESNKILLQLGSQEYKNHQICIFIYHNYLLFSGTQKEEELCIRLIDSTTKQV